MVYYYPNMAYHISTQNESKLKIAKQSYKGVKFIKSCSKLQKLPFKTKVAHKTKSCQKVAEQLVETPTPTNVSDSCLPTPDIVEPFCASCLRSDFAS